VILQVVIAKSLLINPTHKIARSSRVDECNKLELLNPFFFLISILILICEMNNHTILD
jgi:hypothetical protein